MSPVPGFISFYFIISIFNVIPARPVRRAFRIKKSRNAENNNHHGQTPGVI